MWVYGYIWAVLLSLCGSEKILKKFKLVHPIRIFKANTDGCCLFFHPGKRKVKKKKVKSPEWPQWLTTDCYYTYIAAILSLSLLLLLLCEGHIQVWFAVVGSSWNMCEASLFHNTPIKKKYKNIWVHFVCAHGYLYLTLSSWVIAVFRVDY